MSSSHCTYLCINNQTPWSMTTTVNMVDDYDWDSGTSSRPDRNFNNVTLAPGCSQTEREELSGKAKSSHFNMTCTFSNGQVVSFYDDQYEALNGIKPNPRNYPLSGTSASSFVLVQSVDDDTRTSTFTMTSKLLNWMGDLPDSLSLADLTIPGTHDSCATADVSAGKVITGVVAGSLALTLVPLPVPGGATLGAIAGGVGTATAYASAKCQSYSIPDQLDLGIRALDIRCTVDGANVVLCHGIITQDITLRTVFDQCRAFLAANPRETIFMSLKSDYGDSDVVGRGIVGLTYDYPGLFYTGDSIPTLGAARGKIVVGRRFPYGKVWGFDFSGQWCDDASFSIAYVARNGEEQNFYVQDNYDLASSSDKWAQVDGCLNSTPARCQKGTMTLNFASAVGGNWMSDGIPDPSSMAADVNNDLINYFNGRKGHYGIILMDFPTPQEVAEMVFSNS